MAEAYYSGADDLIAGRRRQIAQHRLGGGLYDPRTEIDYGRGVMAAASAKQAARQAAADEKALKERSLDLQETYQTGTLKNQADTLAANKDYQTGVLGINTEANRIKAAEAASLADYRNATVNAQQEARSDQKDANWGNLAMNLGGKLFEGLWGYKKKDEKTGEITRGNQAVDWFKNTLSPSGGESPGSYSGTPTGAYNFAVPGNYDEVDAFPAPAAASTPATPAAAIGDKTSQGPSSTYDTLAKAYGESVESAKPESARLADASLGGKVMNDAGGTLPAIGEPASGKPTSDVPTYEKTDSASQMAAEGTSPASGASQTDTAVATELPAWTGQAPEWQDPEKFSFPSYEPGKYTPPDVGAQPAFSYPAFVAPKPLNSWDAYVYAGKPGDIGDWEGSDVVLTNQSIRNAAEAKWQAAHDAALAAENTRWQNYVNEANAAAQSQYNASEAARLTDYNRQAAEAKAGYDTYWKGEREKYDTALSEYEAAKKAYESQDVGGGSGQSEAKAEAKWDYNQGLGGERVARLEGGHYIRETQPEEPREFSTGYQSPAEMAGGYRGSDYNPTGYVRSEQPTYLGGAAYEPPTGETFSQAQFEEPAWESPYDFSSQYNYVPPDYSSGGYSGGGYEAPNYEPSYYGGGYEAPNYEAGSYGGGNFQSDFAATGGGGSSSGGGGSNSSDDDSIICCELNRRGYLSDEILAKDAEYRENNISLEAYAGYLVVFGPMVAAMKRHTWFAQAIRPFGVAWAKEMASRVDPSMKGNILGKTLLKLGLPVCEFVGTIALKAVAKAVNNAEVA